MSVNLSVNVYKLIEPILYNYDCTESGKFFHHDENVVVLQNCRLSGANSRLASRCRKELRLPRLLTFALLYM